MHLERRLFARVVWHRELVYSKVGCYPGQRWLPIQNHVLVSDEHHTVRLIPFDAQQLPRGFRNLLESQIWLAAEVGQMGAQQIAWIADQYDLLQVGKQRPAEVSGSPQEVVILLREKDCVRLSAVVPDSKVVFPDHRTRHVTQLTGDE